MPADTSGLRTFSKKRSGMPCSRAIVCEATGAPGFVRPPFALKDDLERLDKVVRARAPEAVILYCGRILEALTAAALDAAGLPSVMQVAADLDTLHAFSLTPTATHYWAHALRR